MAKKRLVTLLSVLLMLVIHLSIYAQGTTDVYYSPPTEELDVIKEYNKKLLTLALEKTKATYGNYNIIDSEGQLTQREALKRLNSESIPYVVPTMTDVNRERIFIPVRIPLYKGLFGVRLLMTNKKNERITVNAKNMKTFTFAQGKEWPDTRILQANGVDVETYDTKSDMFIATKAGRVDFFPRAVAEIWDEIDKQGKDDLFVNTQAYFYYPTAIYFFVAKNMEGLSLAKRLEEGLLLAINDGSFDTLFNEYMNPLVEKAQLSSKQAINIINKQLPNATPLTNSKLWLFQNTDVSELKNR